METFRKLSKIEYATIGFMAAYGRRPCPADGQYDVDTANFGIEATNPGTCTGGTPAAPFGPDDGTGHVVGGVVPTKTLGLEDDYAFDGWGKRITYLVDKRATDKTACLALQNHPVNNGVGGITIRESTSGDSISGVMAAYLSHGPDGHGAFPMAGSSLANRIHIGSTDTDTLTNAGVDASFAYSTANFTSIKVMKEKTMTYDDLTYYAEYQKNICCLGKVCVTPGFRIDGSGAGKNLGVYATKIPDLNRDGKEDLAVSDTAGGGHILFGAPNWQNPFIVSTVNGTNGFRIQGFQNLYAISTYLGADMDGDGIQDLIVCASDTGSCSGSNWFGNVLVIIFGGQASWLTEYTYTHAAFWPPTDPINLDGINGVEIMIRSWMFLKNSIGKFNSDDYNDILIGNPYYNDFRILPGRPRPWPSALSVLHDGAATGQIQFTRNVPEHSGIMAFADMNGDGYKDLIVTSSHYPHPGTVHIAYGGDGPEAGGTWGDAPYNLDDLNSAGNPSGTLIYKPAQAAYMGGIISVGNANNDGIDDLLLSDMDGGPNTAGRAFTIFGDEGLPATSWPLGWDMGSVLTGANGFSLIGSWITGTQNGPSAYSGLFFADVNGDGRNDILYGVSPNSSNKFFIKFGETTYDSSYTWGDAVFNGSNGVKITGNTSEDWRDGVNAIGDVNGDHIDDIILGYSLESPGGKTRAGAAYVIFGRTSGWPAVLNLNTLDGTNGFIVNGINAQDRLGSAVAAVDINSDGIKDVVLCAPGADHNGLDSGSCYVIYGKRTDWDAVFDLNDL